MKKIIIIAIIVLILFVIYWKVEPKNNRLNLQYQYAKKIPDSIPIDLIAKDQTIEWETKSDLGFSTQPYSNYWIRLNLIKPKNENHLYFMEVFPSAEYTFFEKRNSKWEQLEFKKRNSRLYKYKIEFNELKEKEIYIKATSYRQRILFQILQENESIRFSFWETMLLGFMFGSLFSFFVSNLFLRLRMIEKSYDYYLLSIVLVFFNILITSGVFEQLIEYYNVELSLHLMRLAYLLVPLGYIIFMQKFIKLEIHSVWVNRFYSYYTYSTLILCILYSLKLIDRNFFYFLARIYILPIVTIITILTSWYLWKKKSINEAKFIFQSYLILAFVVIQQTLATAGLITMDFLSVYGAGLTTCIQLYLFSMALEYRLQSLKKEKETAEAGIQMKDTFVSLLSHDLRTPLIGVFNLLNILSNKDIPKTENEKDDLLELCANSIRNSLSMIKELIDTSKINLGKFTILKTNENLDQLLNEVLIDTKAQLIEKNIRIEKNISKEATVLVDKKIFIHVLKNILSNAIKFSFPNQKIEIQIAESNESSTITIIDYGVGMNLKTIEAIQNDSLKIGTAGTVDEKSNGIGLFICKYILDAHEAILKFESIQGKKTICQIILPR